MVLIVVTNIILEKGIRSYYFRTRSEMIEVQFFFYNKFLIINNIMVVFYGFIYIANKLSKEISEQEKSRFNFYINLQWIKNAGIVIFLPISQRIVGD